MKINSIKEKLNRLKSLDKDFELSGAKHHQYQTTPISEAELQDLETFLGKELPIEYRIFMKKLGYGGGVGYGLLSPKEIKKMHLMNWNYDNKSEDETFVINNFSQITFEDIRTYIDNKKQGDTVPAPWIDSLQGGVIIASEGCLYRYILVIEGELTGCIFQVDMGSGNSIPEGVFYQRNTNYEVDENRLIRAIGGEEAIRLKPDTFREWYEHWLKTYLQAAQNRYDKGKNYIKRLLADGTTPENWQEAFEFMQDKPSLFDKVFFDEIDYLQIHRQQLLIALSVYQDTPFYYKIIENVEVLDISNCGLSEIPNVVWQMPKLTHLDISNNPLITLPDHIKNLRLLKSLNLENTEINHLPNTFTELENLTDLNLENNHLSDLPANFNYLSRLQTFDLNHNEFTKIPKSVFYLHNLNFLDFSFNQLTQISAEICNLDDLEWLFLDNNQLITLPENFGYLLVDMQYLSLSNNRLTELPCSFINFKYNLVHLQLAHNQFMQLPEWIGELEQLEVLNLTHNQLTFLPESFIKLKYLDYLDLSYNQLESVPDDILENEGLRLWGNPCSNQPEPEELDY